MKFFLVCVILQQMNINMLQNQQFASPNQIIKLQPNPIPTSIENDNKED